MSKLFVLLFVFYLLVLRNPNILQLVAPVRANLFALVCFRKIGLFKGLFCEAKSVVTTRNNRSGATTVGHEEPLGSSCPCFRRKPTTIRQNNTRTTSPTKEDLLFAGLMDALLRNAAPKELFVNDNSQLLTYCGAKHHLSNFNCET